MSQTEEKKKPVKERLAEKYAKVYTKAEEADAELVKQAYLAGFERAKALCVDFCLRFCDFRKSPPMNAEEEKLWLDGLKAEIPPSRIMDTIGNVR